MREGNVDGIMGTAGHAPQKEKACKELLEKIQNLPDFTCRSRHGHGKDFHCPSPDKKALSESSENNRTKIKKLFWHKKYTGIGLVCQKKMIDTG